MLGRAHLGLVLARLVLGIEGSARATPLGDDFTGGTALVEDVAVGGLVPDLTLATATGGGLNGGEHEGGREDGQDVGDELHCGLCYVSWMPLDCKIGVAYWVICMVVKKNSSVLELR